MTKWLASIQSEEEAHIILEAIPDILDIKDPAQGALGALNVATVRNIVNLIDHRCNTSATIGDLPMQADVIKPALIKMAGSGVDYLKIGVFPDDSVKDCIIGLADTVRKLRTPVIAVLFADKLCSYNILPLLQASGFFGVMLDTAVKNGQTLLDHMDRLKLSLFIEEVKQKSMMCGLAGALRYEDIVVLKPLGADYLGFRSALCDQRQRKASIELTLAQQIKQAMQG